MSRTLKFLAATVVLLTRCARGPIFIKTWPVVDIEACGRTARCTGAGLGYGLDEQARDALLHACRFTPAVDSRGRHVPIDIPYTFTFELAEPQPR